MYLNISCASSSSGCGKMETQTETENPKITVTQKVYEDKGYEKMQININGFYVADVWLFKRDKFRETDSVHFDIHADTNKKVERFEITNVTIFTEREMKRKYISEGKFHTWDLKPY